MLAQVMGLSDVRDFSKARKVATAWVKRGSTEADAFVKAGNKALKLISDREKKLAALPAFNAAVFASLIEEAAKHIDVLENTDAKGMGGDAARAGLDRADKNLRAAVSAISSTRDISRARTGKDCPSVTTPLKEKFLPALLNANLACIKPACTFKLVRCPNTLSYHFQGEKDASEFQLSGSGNP